ncbi:cytochrome c [uncultured Chitinophaga sp.]|uniref:c-type cytochrome n=1 Tax=uncultured Chitinophaga sp. TaxID=339340 RepID=UPI0025EA8635|nr:cytochrome c [uncultured Chitinophaga sp.]
MFKRLAFLCLILSAHFAGAQDITFNKDIAPIIHRSCTPCHRPGEAAPFSLITYQDVAKRASFIKDVVVSGYMPPWKPDPHYTTFANERKLSDAEVDRIKKWVDQKAPEGKGPAPKTPAFIAGTQYPRKPDLTLTIDQAYEVKGDNLERFIVFKIPFELGDSMNVEALEFVSNNKQTIHHANFAIHPVEESIDIKTPAPFINLTEDDRTKYDQYLPFKKKMTYYGGWIPGTTYESYPKDMGWIMPKRGVVLLTIHYAPIAKDEKNVASINLFFKKTPVKREVKVISIGSGGIGEKDIQPMFYIPANQVKTFKVKVTTPMMDQSLLYVWPHMHVLGKSFKAYAVTPAGDTIKLVNIPDWDFRWQEIYRFKTLVKIPEKSVLTVEGTYDNTAGNPNNPSSPPKMVFSAGDMKTTDEMLTLLMVFLPYQPGDEAREL